MARTLSRAKAMNTYHRALTIAGSDSSGGAGIQADLKTFSALGCYGLSVITALTAQNTQAVLDIHPVPSAFVASQLRAVLDDVGADAVKIGMLHSPEVIHTVATLLKQYEVGRIVVDPVMFSKGGDRLIQDPAVAALREVLVPLATVLTPNLPEAAELLRRSLKTRDHMDEACRELLALGPRAVVIKGGHLDIGGSDDYLAFRNEQGEVAGEWLPGRREETRNVHGAGCTFASAVAALLARGHSPEDAVRQAKEYIRAAIKAGAEYTLGKGQGPVAHFHQWWPRAESGS